MSCVRSGAWIEGPAISSGRPHGFYELQIRTSQRIGPNAFGRLEWIHPMEVHVFSSLANLLPAELGFRIGSRVSYGRQQVPTVPEFKTKFPRLTSFMELRNYPTDICSRKCSLSNYCN